MRGPCTRGTTEVREVEQLLELVVNFQNDPMAVRIISSATLSLPLPHLNSLVPTLAGPACTDPNFH
jgi:hypothetical protein